MSNYGHLVCTLILSLLLQVIFNKCNIFYNNNYFSYTILFAVGIRARTLYVNFDVFEVFGLNLLVSTTIRYPLGDVSSDQGNQTNSLFHVSDTRTSIRLRWHQVMLQIQTGLLFSAVFTDRVSILTSRNQNYIINIIIIRNCMWRSRSALKLFIKIATKHNISLLN